MTTRRIPTRRAWAADVGRIAGGLALPVLVLGALGARHGVVPPDAILPVLFLGFLLGIGGLALGIYALVDIWRSGVDGARAAITGIVYASPIVALLLLIAGAAAVYPRLTDVTTDTDRPPLFAGPEGPRGGFDPANAALQRDAYPNLATRVYDKPVGDVYAAARSLMERRGWTLTRTVEPQPPVASVPPAAAPAETPVLSPEQERRAAEERAEAERLRLETLDEQWWGRIGAERSLPRSSTNRAVMEATARTLIFAFPDDVVVRLIGTPTGTRVDMRSASREGEHDLGQNARRIHFFLAALDRALQPEPEAGTEGVASIR